MAKKNKKTREDEVDERGEKRADGGTRVRAYVVHTPADGSRVSHATTWRQGSSRSTRLPFSGTFEVPTAKIIDSL